MKYSYEIALSFAMEDKEIVEKVYHYLRAEDISVFYAPASESQVILSGKNQREIFYEIFGLKAKYVALFVSKTYITKKIPMEEASIAIAKHSKDGSVIPIYLDNASLPADLFSPQDTNYFKSKSPAEISNHLAEKIKAASDEQTEILSDSKSIMNVKNNKAEKQIFVQNLSGSIEL